MKTIFQYMDVTTKSVEEFNDKLAQMCGAKYILAEGKISEVLQAITKSKILYDCIQTVLKGFDYPLELSKCRFSDHIVLPKKGSAKIAFVFYLLLSIDTRQINLKEFLHTYFTADNPNEEYFSFCEKFILPFSQNITKFLNGEKLDDETEQAQEIKSPSGDNQYDKIQSGEQSGAYLDKVQRDTLLSVIKDIVEVCLSERAEEDIRREETLLVCEGFVLSALKEDKSRIRIMYVALKNTLTLYPLENDKNLPSELLHLMQEYDIVK